MMLQTFTFGSVLTYIGGILGIISFLFTFYRHFLEIAPKPRLGIQTVLQKINAPISQQGLFCTLSVENVGKKDLKLLRALLLVEEITDLTDVLPLHHDGKVLMQLLDPDASAIDLTYPCSGLDIDEADFAWLKDQRLVYLQNIAKFQREDCILGNNDTILEYARYNLPKSGYFRVSIIILAKNGKIYTRSAIVYV